MTKLDDFQRAAEAEVHRGRNQGSLGTLWDLTQNLSLGERTAYHFILGPLGYPDESKNFQAEIEVPEWARISACRLALLGMHFDSAAPRWSSWLLNNVINGVQSVPQGSDCDLFKAMWQIISENNLPLTRGVAQFIKDTVRNLLSRHQSPLRIDLLWLLPWPELMTPTQAYFIFNTLALKPELFTSALEQKIECSLRDTDFHKEILPSP